VRCGESTESAAAQGLSRTFVDVVGVSETGASRSEVRFRGQSGKHVLILSLTAFDPTGHLEAFTRLAYRP